MAMAPYAAVAIGLYGLQNAWVAILGYHAQILFWVWRDRRDRRDPRDPRDRRDGRGPAAPAGLFTAPLKTGWSAPLLLGLGLPGLLLGPVLWVLLDVALRAGLVLGDWLARYGLSGSGWLLFVAYYGLLHPSLEQLHWDRLRRDRRRAGWAHLLFAGYHVLVLMLLLKPVWVAVSFGVLLATSIAWARVREHLGGLAVVAASHTIADAALMVTVYLLAGRL